MSKTKTWDISQLESAVNDSTSMAGVIRKLGLIPAGGNYKVIKRYIKDEGLDTSHFKGQGWSKGLGITVRPAQPLDELLVEDSYYQSNRLKQRLIKEGLLLPICAGCGLVNWLENPIPLELDHINGVNNDNRIGNLRLLCPNCHALTPTYRGKNKVKPQ